MWYRFYAGIGPCNRMYVEWYCWFGCKPTKDELDDAWSSYVADHPEAYGGYDQLPELPESVRKEKIAECMTQIANAQMMIRALNGEKVEQ